MSLLMDALKKAELAKSRAPDSASTPSLPDTSPEANAGTSPSLAERLELLDDEFVAMAANSPRPSAAEQANVKATTTSNLTIQEMAPPAPSFKLPDAKFQPAKADDSQRSAVQNLFETKQPAPSRKKFAVAVGACAVLAAAAIGFYFWNELQPKSGMLSANNVRQPPSTPLLPIAVAPVIAPTPFSGPKATTPGDAVPSEQKQAPPAEEVAAARLAVAPAKKLFRVSSATPLSNQSLDRAYDALTRGDNAAAKTAYEQVLTGDPKNVDAMSGLAVIAQRSGNAEQAADYYLHMLEADPRNTTAMAGLVDLQSQMNPGVAEVRLKQALSSQPDSAALNFSLGNIYAKAKRWADAQQAYFKASTADPGNPDYLFNLAVSLDQLQQPRLAAKYYAQALAAAKSRPTAIDQAQAQERLQKLQQLP